MPYQPTGKPAGRPRNDGKPPQAKPKPQEERKGIGIVQAAQERPFNEAPCCAVCHPDGWPKGWTGYGCEHGIWARRA